MKSLKTSEADFQILEEIDFEKNKKLSILINVISLPLFVLFYFLFFYIAVIIGAAPPNDYLFFLKNLSGENSWIFLIIILGNLFLHEAIHGIFLYAFTGAMPKVGFKIVYGYAGAPDWFIQKNLFYIISLSPLVLITAAGFIFMMILAPEMHAPIFMAVTLNAAGSLGDIYVSYRLLRSPDNVFVNDTGLCARIGHCPVCH